jgi:hypothetical protein
MKNETNNKVPKSDKNKLDDLTPKKDAPGGIVKRIAPVVPGSVAPRPGPAPITLPPPNP